MQHHDSNSRKKRGLLHPLKTLKNQQDQLKGLKTDIYSSILAKAFNGDTIPIMLKVNGDYLEMAAFSDGNKPICPFLTKYFRIECIDEKCGTMTLSLLRPLDILNCVTNRFEELYCLEKTCSIVIVKICWISAIQCLDIDLMNRKIIVEPKD